MQTSQVNGIGSRDCKRLDVAAPQHATSTVSHPTLHPDCPHRLLYLAKDRSSPQSSQVVSKAEAYHFLRSRGHYAQPPGLSWPAWTQMGELEAYPPKWSSCRLHVGISAITDGSDPRTTKTKLKVEISNPEPRFLNHALPCISNHYILHTIYYLLYNINKRLCTIYIYIITKLSRTETRRPCPPVALQLQGRILRGIFASPSDFGTIGFWGFRV